MTKDTKEVKRWIATWSRWLHIYLSMFSFMLLLFFAVTGITLNHTEWFANQQHTTECKGKLNVQWVHSPDTVNIAKLEIVEYLRKTHTIKGALSDFIIDDYQCTTSFVGPGYSADVFIDRATGDYELSETNSGFIAIINDLHKGRDTGKPWRVVIDLAAVLMVLVSLTGLIMIFFLKKKVVVGLLLVLLGMTISYLAYVLCVP